MTKPIVALVGRPNVGKSTLFNRLVGERMAIVDDTPGTTRDRLFGEAEWNGRAFHVVDTGGIDPTHGGKTPLSVGSADFIEEIKSQAQVAIREADAVLFVNDGEAGVTSPDLEVATILRRSQKKLKDGTFWPPIFVVVNKCESKERRDNGDPVLRVGAGRPDRHFSRARDKHRRPAGYAGGSRSLSRRRKRKTRASRSRWWASRTRASRAC